MRLKKTSFSLRNKHAMPRLKSKHRLSAGSAFSAGSCQPLLAVVLFALMASSAAAVSAQDMDHLKCQTSSGYITRVKDPVGADGTACDLPQDALQCSEKYILKVGDDCSFSLESQLKECASGKGAAYVTSGESGLKYGFHVGSGLFNSPTNETFTMRYYFDEAARSHFMAVKFTVPELEGKCQATYNLSSPARFDQGYFLDYVTNNTCEPGTQTLNMIEGSTSGGASCKADPAEVECYRSLKLTVDADCTGTLTQVDTSTACPDSIHKLKLNISRLVNRLSHVAKQQNAYFIGQALDTDGEGIEQFLAGGNTGNEERPIFVNPGNNCQWFYQLEDTTKPLVTFSTNETAPGESPSPSLSIVLPGGNPPSPPPSKPTSGASATAAAAGVQPAAALLAAAIMALLLAGF